MTPPRFRSLGQPETRFAYEEVVTQLNAQKDGLFWLVWRSCFYLVRSTKIEAPLIGLWPKSFSVTVTRRLSLIQCDESAMNFAPLQLGDEPIRMAKVRTRLSFTSGHHVQSADRGELSRGQLWRTEHVGHHAGKP